MEKRLVDANSITCENTWKEWSDDHGDYVVCTAPTVLAIPENPTNGDVIKALFPNGVISYGRTRVYYSYGSNGCFDFHKEWWNAPYKENNNDK